MTTKPSELVATLVSPPDGDWEAFYLNDKLITQGHQVQLYEIFQCLGIKFAEKEVSVNDGDLYPDSLSEAMKQCTRSS